MTDAQKRLVKLLEEERTIDQLQEELKLTSKQLYQRLQSLKNNGYLLKREDYSSGDISYLLSHGERDKEEQNSKIIYTPPNSRTLKVLLISDLHLGNTLSRVDILDKIYEHCVKKNIHIIFNMGDLVNGFLQTMYGSPIQGDYEQQIEKALKDFPFDPKIINYLVLGNHDNDFKKTQGIDLITKISAKRYDIFPISYFNGKIKIKNDSIYLTHPEGKNNSNMKNKITFRGHSHKSKFLTANNKLYVYVPSYSDIIYNSSYSYPSLMEANFQFSEKGYIKEVSISTFLYINKLIKAGEMNSSFDCPQNAKEILYEKDFPKNSVNVVHDENSFQKVKRLTQIEKFKSRYGNFLT